MSTAHVVSGISLPATDFTVNELMAATVARALRDDEMGFVGVGSGGRAFTLTFGIPVVAARLAQHAQAPNFSLQLGSMVSPDLSAIPSAASEASILNIRYDLYWPAAGRIQALDNMDLFAAGRGVNVGFVSAAQIDAYGNTNITCIGSHDRPRVRLVGCLAQPELMAFTRRAIVMLDLSPRVFVQRVDFVTSAGYLTGGDARKRAGIPGGGPELVVTDKAVFDFEPEAKRMRLRSVHPGVTVEDVLAHMGFRPATPESVPETPPPSPEQVRLIREVIDPRRILLGG